MIRVWHSLHVQQEHAGMLRAMAVLDSVFVFVLLYTGSVIFNIYDVFHSIAVIISFDASICPISGQWYFTPVIFGHDPSTLG